MLPGNVELSEELIKHLKVVSISETSIVLKHEWRDVTVIVTSDGLHFYCKVGDT